ncbi:hypothetical protein [Pedobacter sp.]|uniref:hypothetical protein n=1 Tax=Pedobacter sp. TaxID=1411316 RepID=UPI003C67757C
MENHQHRPLGVFEKVCAIFDKISPLDFALAVEIVGETSLPDWRIAMDKVQLRHPNMRVFITEDECDGYHFEPTGIEVKVPIKTLLEEKQSAWAKVIERESADGFQDGLPLVRMIYLPGQGGCTVILIAHHAVADGLSLTFVIRDLLEEITGTSRKAHHPPISVDSRLGMDEHLPVLPLPKIGSSRYRQNINLNSPTKIQYLKFKGGLTQQILTRCKSEKTTLHGALCAAAVVQARRQCLLWQNCQLHVLSPISVRKILDVEDDCFLCMSTHAAFFDPYSSSAFWDMARDTRESLHETTLASHLAEFISALQGVVQKQSLSEQRIKVLKQIFSHHLMISNLGELKFETHFASLKIESVWGPFMRSGSEHTQTLGGITCNGNLHLTNTTAKPLPGFLEGIEQILEHHCAVNS